jgi:hypothetical protein
MDYAAFADILRELRGHPDKGIITALTMTARDVSMDYTACYHVVNILQTELAHVSGAACVCVQNRRRLTARTLQE